MLNYDEASPEIRVTCTWITNGFVSVRYGRSLELIHTSPNKSPCNSRTGMERGGAGVHVAAQDELWEETSSRLPKQSQFIEPQWSLPPKDINEGEIPFLAPTTASTPAKRILSSLSRGRTKRPSEVSLVMMSLYICISLGKNRSRGKGFFYGVCAWYQKNVQVSPGMRFSMWKMKAFCLKAFLFSMKLIKIKISVQNKTLKPWDASLNGSSGSEISHGKSDAELGNFSPCAACTSCSCRSAGSIAPRFYFIQILRQTLVSSELVGGSPELLIHVWLSLNREI